MPTHGFASRWLNVPYPAADERRLDSTLLMPGSSTQPFSARPGRRVNSSGLVGSVSGSPEQWFVTPGGGVIYDANYATQGPWRFEVPAQVSGSMGARPATGQSRIDLLVARIYDTEVIGSGPRDVVVERVQGTAGSSPTAPSVPALSHLIATLTVPNSGSVTVVANPQVTVAAGGVLPVSSTAERDALVSSGQAYPGLVVFDPQVSAWFGRTATGAWMRLQSHYIAEQVGDVYGADATLRDPFIGAAPAEGTVKIVKTWQKVASASSGNWSIPIPGGFGNGITNVQATLIDGAGSHIKVTAAATSLTAVGGIAYNGTALTTGSIRVALRVEGW